MKIRAILPVIVGAIALMGPGGAHAEPMELGTDPANDWGKEEDPEIYPLGDALGQELVSAAIDNTQPGLATFIIRVKSLPTTGGLPEGTRYIWEMKVNGLHMELDGKFTNYSRGACDPTAGKCGVEASYTQDPLVVNATVKGPRDPGNAPFFLRGNCASNGAAYLCEELAVIEASFDAATGEIRIPVPVSLLTPQACAVVAPDVNTASFTGIQHVIAISSAFVSYNPTPHDWIAFEDEEAATVSVC